MASLSQGLFLSFSNLCVWDSNFTPFFSLFFLSELGKDGDTLTRQDLFAVLMKVPRGVAIDK